MLTYCYHCSQTPTIMIYLFFIMSLQTRITWTSSVFVHHSQIFPFQTFFSFPYSSPFSSLHLFYFFFFFSSINISSNSLQLSISPKQFFFLLFLSFFSQYSLTSLALTKMLFSPFLNLSLTFFVLDTFLFKLSPIFFQNFNFTGQSVEMSCQCLHETKNWKWSS